MGQMKALSLHQPWASLIAVGLKPIETRRWATTHRGPLLIVSTLKTVMAGFPRSIPRNLRLYGYALCIVNLVDVRAMKDEDEEAAMCSNAVGQWAWVLEDVRRVRTVRIMGRQRLYDVDVVEHQVVTI